MNTKTWLILGGAVLCVAVVVGIVQATASGVPVDTAPVERGPIREYVDERAMTRLPETFLITMPFAGRIEAIELEEGMAVAKDQVVAQIVRNDLDLSVEQATAARDRLDASIRENADVEVEETAFKQAQQFAVSMAQTVDVAWERVLAGNAKFAYAESDLGRVRKAVTGGAQTEDEQERAELRLKEAGHALQEDKLVHAATVALKAATDLMPTMVRQFINRKTTRTGEVLQKQKAEAEAQLRQVMQDQQRGTMRSPVDGVVLQRSISNERFLSAGTTLLEVGHLQDLEVEADVLSLDVVDAEVGDPVEIYGPAIGLPRARGTVARIFPAGFTKISSLGVEQQRVKVIVRFAPDDLARLLKDRRVGVGYRVRVKITTAEKPETLTIPRSALFRGADGLWQVYVVRGGRARIQEIEIGLINDERVEVVKGLAADEQVVLAPESNLENDARVAVQAGQAAGG
ncbi:MAG: HlyD family efflux transporter periplasmic adaptor subunit [Pirellulales bacterium]|nr:HlyD family efflux transporter periplasmic adaptor subunit [Pirellulales bacterium]